MTIFTELFDLWRMPASSVFIPAVYGKCDKSYVVFCIILGFCDCILAGEFWNKTTSRPDARERIACLHQSCHGIDPLPQTPHTFSTDTPKQSINGFSVPDAKDYNDTLSKSLCISKISMSLLRMLQLWTHPDNLTRDTPLFTSCPPPQSRHTGKSPSARCNTSVDYPAHTLMGQRNLTCIQERSLHNELKFALAQDFLVRPMCSSRTCICVFSPVTSVVRSSQ